MKSPLRSRTLALLPALAGPLLAAGLLWLGGGDAGAAPPGAAGPAGAPVPETRAPARALASGSTAPVDPPQPEGATLPSRFGKLTSRRWGYGASYFRENLEPVPNPHPSPEPHPRRDHPYDVAVLPDGSKVYVSLLGSEAQPGSELAVYDVARGEVVRRILLRPAGEAGPPGSSPYRLALHPAGRFLVVTNRFSSFASVIDTTTDAVVSEIPLDFYGQGLVFDAAGSRAWVADRYLDQLLPLEVQASGGSFQAKLLEQPGLDDRAYLEGSAGEEPLHRTLVRRCGGGSCHDAPRGGFVAGRDAKESFLSALAHVRPGDPKESRLLRAVTRSRDGGYADRVPLHLSHAMGTVVFPAPAKDPDFQALSRWIDRGTEGPGIPVGNPGSKPKIVALSSDGKLLLVGNTGTQDISVVDTALGREVGAIYVQNVINDLKVFRSPANGHDYLVVTTEGIGFGVASERDPYGAESHDRENPAAQFSVHRDLGTGQVLPREQQQLLGPYDVVDGTAAIKFRDVQNDVVLLDLSLLEIPARPPAGALPVLASPNRYESHRAWVRYTSDTAESTLGDLKGDIAPDLMRVVGALPEKLALDGDRLFVTMQGSSLVQEWRLDPTAADPSDSLTPVRTYETGLQPIGLAVGPAGTVAAGQLFVANFLSGTLSVIDRQSGASREVIIDPSVVDLPFPATNSERGELVAHTALFSSDGDSSCFHCHYLDMGDGRAWGVSQVVGQEYLPDAAAAGQLVIGGAMGVPQMRALFRTQPFFFEGTLSAFEPRSMLMEHAPADDFGAPTPQGDFTALTSHRVLLGTEDVQSSMSASTGFASDLVERRDELMRNLGLRYFGKAFVLRDLQRFVGEWQIHEGRLLPDPFDRRSRSVLRGKALFEDVQVGCAACHPAPDFTRKDFPDNPQQAIPPVVTVSPRDASFTLVGMDRLDAINGVPRDLEPWDTGRAEVVQGQFTIFPLRGIWDRPPVFLHNGLARTLRETVCTPGHQALRKLKYEPLVGGVPERPGRREVGFNETLFVTEPIFRARPFLATGGRIGLDTHGGTSQLRAAQIDDLVDFLESIE